jgi:hypothetical protein
VLNVLPFLISEELTMTRDTSVRDTDTIQEETEGKTALLEVDHVPGYQCPRHGHNTRETEGKTALQRLTMTRHNKQYRTGGENLKVL